ncbi:iron chelate uptake ABC transporter family permease subunit [Paracoccus sp. CPCC 101403]|uniref:Iron chelate uptake ABC transporter family permease subunit n=1 Tax=Paracoccus broussonetiae TaxID=3075834 RepID=A0ABU3EFZ5_9RHOB|nr:iron chelate uptake ABC transporter family permease subunit [Paracoccus sp. CPCC 101403]MDT1063169.1 iron chelate uptake ABC transporter family permease subunit [Paracoccus sp. CPCC 101403]
MRLVPAGLAVLALLACASLTVGAASVSILDATRDPRAALILMESRLPRTLAVILTGAALAVAGVVLQALVRNRFVGPETTGTAESAALGLLAVSVWAPASPIWAKMVAASLAAMAGTALFVAVIRRIPVREVMLVPIAGLVLSGVIGSVATFVGWQTDLLQYVNAWLMAGEFSGVLAGRYELLWVAAAAAGLAWFAADRFAILGLGEGVATGLGLSPGGVMRLGLAVVAVVTAMVVTTVGMIPFVGLVVPNIVARVMGDNLRASIPAVAVLGAVLLLACDLLGRLVRFPYEIPVGTILGVVGAMIFLWLLYRRPAHG